MTTAIKSFSALFLTTAFLTTGAGLLSSLLSINMSLHGYSETMIGLVMSGNYVGFVLGIFLCQPVVQRVGHIRAFATFAAVITVTAMLYGMFLSALFWGVLRILNGLSVTGMFMVIESWLNEKVDPVFRGRVLSIYMILVYFGNGFGQLLLNTGDVQGQRVFMLVGMLFVMSLVPISTTRAVNPEPLKVPIYNILKLFKLAPFSMVGAFTAGLINSSFYALAPVFGLKIGLEVSQVSLFMTITIWSGLAFQWPVGLLSDRMDRLTVLSVLGMLVMIVSVGILTLGHINYGVLLVLTACFGVVFSIYAVAMARAQDNLPKENIVPVTAALILFFGLGACLGPVLASAAVTALGPWGLYGFSACCGGALSSAAWLSRKKLARKIKHPVPHIPIPKTSSAVGVLDPRGDAFVTTESPGPFITPETNRELA